MAQVQIQQQSDQSYQIQADSLSQLAFLNLITLCSINHFSHKPKDSLYFHDSFENRKDYFEITDRLKKLSKDTELPDPLPFAHEQIVSFNIPGEHIENLIAKMKSHYMAELRELADKMATELDLDIKNDGATKKTNPLFTKNYNPSQVSLVDIDRSIENKIIFYYLYQANNNELEKITEKIDLMTLEQKENFIEQIFNTSPLQKLPKIIYNHIFCTLKIVAPFVEVAPLCLKPSFKIILQQPVHYLGYSTPEEIKNSSDYEDFLTLMERAKSHFEQTLNPYVLPATFNQQCLVALDLQSLSDLKSIESPIKNKIFEQITKYAPFTKNLINNGVL